MSQFINVIAGSGYGSRVALYEVVEGVLVLRHEGDHDNLAGNGVALDFEGLTVDQAGKKAKAITDEPVGHDYDGCHSCCFSVTVTETEPPDWYVYKEPAEAVVIREALARLRSNTDGRSLAEKMVDALSLEEAEKLHWQLNDQEWGTLGKFERKLMVAARGKLPVTP